MAADRAAVLAKARLRAPLLRWYRRAKRDLPWRRTRDPYAIWVSEVMLQQTTVAAVTPYWERFLDRFPGLATLAKSREEEVLALWSGLGYYRRARALRRGAIAVVEQHEGRVPDNVDGLLGLPGIGRYTAGAIASLAFGRESAVVDGNVKRVFARLFAIRGGDAALTRRSWQIADVLVPGRNPGDWNQALMELGATICTPRSPRCPECPVADVCRARALGRPTAFPAAVKAKPVRAVPVAIAWIVRGESVLLLRQREGGPLRGAWDLPAVIVTEPNTSARELSALIGARVRLGRSMHKAKHSILATRLEIEVFDATSQAAPKRSANVRFVPLDGLHEAAVSGATLKIARAIAAQRRSHDLHSPLSSKSSTSSRSSGSKGRVKAYGRASIRGTAPKATSSPAQ